MNSEPYDISSQLSTFILFNHSWHAPSIRSLCKATNCSLRLVVSRKLDIRRENSVISSNMYKLYMQQYKIGSKSTQKNVKD